MAKKSEIPTDEQKIKCTLGDVFGASNPGERGLPALSALDLQQMNIKAALQWRRISRAVRAEYALIEDQRKDLIDKHVKKDADEQPITDGNRYVMADQAAFDAEWRELMEAPAEIDARPMPLELIENLTMRPADIDALAFLIEEL